MTAKRASVWAAAVLLVGLLLPSSAPAGPYLGDWSWFWHPAPDCPCGAYCFMHYWTPQYYRVRACVHPSNVDQYPPATPVQARVDFRQFPCRSTLPAPATPYAVPTGYYGRAVALPFALP